MWSVKLTLMVIAVGLHSFANVWVQKIENTEISVLNLHYELECLSPQIFLEGEGRKQKLSDKLAWSKSTGSEQYLKVGWTCAGGQAADQVAEGQQGDLHGGAAYDHQHPGQLPHHFRHHRQGLWHLHLHRHQWPGSVWGLCYAHC